MRPYLEGYDLQFVTVHGLDPEGEPSAAEITEVVEKIEEEGITIFYRRIYQRGFCGSSRADEVGYYA